GLRPEIERIVDELLDRMAQHQTVDLMPALAAQVPAKTTCALLGVPESDSERLLGWTQTLVSMSFAPLGRFAADGAAPASYIVALVESKRASPGQDVISAIIHARDADEQLSEEEVQSLIGVLLIGAFETTSNLIGNGTLALLQHPKELALLRSKPELLPDA